jgi:phage baseplate assembly protein gpV
MNVVSYAPQWRTGESLMKKLLILVCTLAISSAAFAAPAKTTRSTAHMNGTIAKYDPATRTLTLRHDKNKETSFQINDQSEVMKGKSKADASSLATSAGQAAKVDYVMEGSNRIVEKVDVAATHIVAKKK